MKMMEGWVQKRFYDIGWSDEKKCRGCNKEEGTENTDCIDIRVGRNSNPRGIHEIGAQSKNIKERLEVTERNHG